jgi:hypothetical protein
MIDPQRAAAGLRVPAVQRAQRQQQRHQLPLHELCRENYFALENHGSEYSRSAH